MALNIVDESTLTVAGTSIGLSSADPTLAAAELSGARQAAITVLTAPVCYHQDGGAATTADPVLYLGDVLQVFGDNMHQVLTNLRFIRLTSTSGALVIRWYDRDVIHAPIVVHRATGHDVSAVGHGVETVDSAGTHQKISTTSVPAKWVIIQAQTDNTTAIAVGITGVDATIATGTGLILYAGDWTPMLPINNLQDIWIDALTTGEGVRFIYFK